MQHYPLLKLLADGCLHSGTQLARTLGVSRTAVWKQLQQLNRAGVTVETVRGRGYRLVAPPDMLDRSRILSGIPSDQGVRVSLEVLGEVASTNQYLLERESQVGDYDICLAERQTRGRGRSGRDWESPFARNLYLSLSFETEGAVQAIQGVTLVAGAAVAHALEGLGVSDVRIKWPNDIWLGERKVAGILSELQGSIEDRFRIVIGLGLNVYMSDDEVRIDQPWTSLARNGWVPQGGRNAIACAVVQHLIEWLDTGVSINSAAFRSFWNARDALAGRAVTVKGKALAGVARGIDSSGQLRIETASGTEDKVNAGEVSVRPKSCDSAD